MHANGDTSDQLVLMEVAEIEEGILRDEEAKNVGYSAFFKTRGNKLRLLTTCVIAAGQQLGGNTLVSYYLSPILKLIGITKPAEQAGINAGLSIVGLITVLVAAQFVERIGRRPLWLGGIAAMMVTFACVTGLSGAFASTKKPSIGVAVIPFLYLFQISNVSCYTTLSYLYAVEINPYTLRAKALSIYVCVQGIAYSFNQYVNPIALAHIAWKYYFVFIAFQILFFTYAWFFFIETRGYTIEEVSRLFDGQDQAAAVSQAAAEKPDDSGLEDEKQVVPEHNETKVQSLV